MLSLLDLNQTNSNEANISFDNKRDVVNNSTSITNLPDFSVVNEHKDSDSSSGLLYCVEDDISDTDYDNNHELDAKFYSI